MASLRLKARPRPTASRFTSKSAAISRSTSSGQPWPTPPSSV